MDVGSQEALMVIAVVISICWLECKCNWFFPFTNMWDQEDIIYLCQLNS